MPSGNPLWWRIVVGCAVMVAAAENERLADLEALYIGYVAMGLIVPPWEVS